MRIAVITSSYPRFQGDGTAPFVKSLSEALVERGHDIRVVAPYDTLVVDDHAQQVPVRRFKYIWPTKWHILGHARSLEGDAKLHPLAVILLPFFLFSAFISLVRVTHQQSSEVIHAHWLLPNGVVAALVARLRKIPFIVSLHGSDMFVANKNFLFRSVARYVLKRTSGVSACSPDLMSSALDLHPGLNIRLIPWGADPEKFIPLVDKKTARQVLGWQENGFAICSLGRMVEKKGFDLLVDSFNEVVRSTQRANLQLVIGGQGPLRSQLLDQARALNLNQKVFLPGSVNWDQVPLFLGAADCFVLPSIKDRHGNLDGLPTVLLEAMACALPCIASDIGGVSLVLLHNENGLLVTQGDRRLLADAIRGVISDPARSRYLAENARSSVVRKYNWDAVAQDFEKLLSGALIKNTSLRIGSQYRSLVLPGLITLPDSKIVLDLGCHDSGWISTIPGKLKIGVDLDPLRSHQGAILVKADINHLPFKAASVDMVYALDLIEHLDNAGNAVQEMERVLKNDGSFLVTTPSDDVRLYPGFLTGFISKKWGHYFRRGYSQNELSCMFTDYFDVNIRSWKALAFRKRYLFIRSLSEFCPRWASRNLVNTAQRDLLDPWGEKGFWIMTGNKRGQK